MTIKNIAWVLPRPSKSKYIGSFPLYFESRLVDLLRLRGDAKILQPFGGKAEYGIKCDINPEVQPDVVCDAHYLPFEDNTFDLVLLDPPYSEDYADRLYDTAKKGKLKFGQYTKEAVRVCREGGYIVIYHCLATPAIKNTRLIMRIFIETRQWHKLRCVHIHKKDTLSWLGVKGQSPMKLEC